MKTSTRHSFEMPPPSRPAFELLPGQRALLVFASATLGMVFCILAI